jgi:eukaryotic-like serine/threonine-protein kinase
VPLRILIVDDHPEYRAWLGHHLAVAQPDAQVVEHDPASGAALPADVEVASWDLIFLDHSPGEHDGLALLGELKGRPDCPPVVFLTPQGDQQAIVQALQAGADDYLAKGRNSNEHIRRVMREALRRGQRLAGSRPPPANSGGKAPFRLKGHRFLKELGSGSTASVYLMEQELRQRLVVVKVFRRVPDRIQLFQPLQRFLREYEVVSSVRHPNIVEIFDLGIADDLAFIVMEYFAGGHLGERMAGGLQADQALDYLLQIGRALEAIHGVGVLHRDLKPANIMVRDDGSLALIDFGVAKLLDVGVDLTAIGEIFGTPYYMSPEQGEGSPVDERSDIYSLGILFHEMLTGRKPYTAGSSMAVIWKHRHAPLPVLPPGLARFQPLLDRMLAKDPGARFAAASELLAAAGGLRDVRAIAASPQ